MRKIMILVVIASMCGTFAFAGPAKNRTAPQTYALAA